MHVGYARVSTLDQNPQLQIDALKQAGCERLYVEKASGAHRDRPELKAALAYMAQLAGSLIFGQHKEPFQNAACD